MKRSLILDFGLTCLAVEVFLWLGWRGEVVYWGSGLLFAFGTIYNQLRAAHAEQSSHADG